MRTNLDRMHGAVAALCNTITFLLWFSIIAGIFVGYAAVKALQ